MRGRAECVAGRGAGHFLGVGGMGKKGWDSGCRATEFGLEQPLELTGGLSQGPRAELVSLGSTTVSILCPPCSAHATPEAAWPFTSGKPQGIPT